MYIKRDNVRIKRILVLDWHDVIVDSKKVFSLNMNSLFYLKLKTRLRAPVGLSSKSPWGAPVGLSSKPPWWNMWTEIIDHIKLGVGRFWGASLLFHSHAANGTISIHHYRQGYIVFVTVDRFPYWLMGQWLYHIIKLRISVIVGQESSLFQYNGYSVLSFQ